MANRDQCDELLLNSAHLNNPTESGIHTRCPISPLMQKPLPTLLEDYLHITGAVDSFKNKQSPGCIIAQRTLDKFSDEIDRALDFIVNSVNFAAEQE